MSKAKGKASGERQQVRCAIYTRKSTEEGLQQEFNSLDAQRESAEAYIAAQKHEGWTCLPDRYDDGGFTGGNMDRPAVQRLMKDIAAGKVDCVVVYKVDRLSRSLMDFARIMETFDNHHVSFVSVTQQFNTTHSMGRLTLNILLSFAQFEREIISERTRDKIAAARRKGKFAGGRPILGYDLLSSPAGPRLVVNDEEAHRVRVVFDLYLQHGALIPVVQELDRRGWRTKAWTTKGGRQVGGLPLDKNLLYRLLTNVVYVGKIRHHEEVHPGEHTAIVDEQVWQRAQAVLQHNGRTGGTLVRNRYGALLKGLIRCAPCGCAMMHTYSAQKNRRYRYYVCMKAQKRGWNTCPTKSVPAGEIEKFVVEQIKAVGQDPAVLTETVRQAQRQGKKALDDLQAEERAILKDMARLDARLRKLASGAATPELADTQERLHASEQRATQIRAEIVALGGEMVNESEVQAALSAFEPVWDTLSPREQARIIRLLVERVDYDGKVGTVAVTFRPNGIKTFTQELAETTA
ncbi:MAG: recombinase family protein [Phycisphaeraceae bacterium]|nr:recombinase family protein [Phycisphaeraceae bacterium]